MESTDYLFSLAASPSKELPPLEFDGNWKFQVFTPQSVPCPASLSSRVSTSKREKYE
jgi:hypothetical protein